MRNHTGAGIRARSKNAISAALFAGASLAGLPLAAHAADADSAAVADADAERAHTVSEVVATGNRKHLESPKYTAPLLDTPQTITVVPKEVIEAQNLLTLRDILSTVPGITFGAGEGGGGYGDSINLRGYAANSDITVDGVRDSAQYTRSDPFNLEQIEVTNGANGAIAGSGSVGGSINIVSKTPISRDATTISAAAGTDSYGRLTIDTNKTFGEGVAFRLNAMAHQNDAPGRDVENFKRWGVAPSLTIGLDGPTQFNLAYFHQTDDNIPQYGVPYVFNAFRQGVVPGVDRSAYYGFSNVDTQQIDVDSLTARFDHSFSDTLSLRSLVRYQVVEQFTIATQPQGAFCLANGLNASTNVACASPDTFVRSSGGVTRDTRNTNLYGQTDLRAEFNTGAIAHTLIAGVALMEETFRLRNGQSLRGADGSVPAPAFLTTAISNPNSVYAGPLNFIQSGASHGERSNQAIYLFDTAELSPQWEVNFGARFEHNEGSNRTDAYSTAVGPTLGVVTQGPALSNEDNLFSWRAGVVFKPVAVASLYFAYGNSQTPSQSAVNGACTAATCNVDPEEAVNYEFGGKWDALDGGRLSLTAAVFRNERTNYKVASNEPGVPDQVLDGQSRVDGLTLGAVGRLTEQLSIFANYTYLDSEVVRGKSLFCVANPAAAGCPAADADPTGRPLTSTPRHSASLWLTYDVNSKLQLGYGVTHLDDVVLSNTVVPAAGGFYTVDGYTTHRASVTYQVSRDVEVRLNVNNLTDEDYLTRVRTSATGWATPGDARNATLTVNYRF